MVLEKTLESPLEPGLPARLDADAEGASTAGQGRSQGFSRAWPPGQDLTGVQALHLGVAKGTEGARQQGLGPVPVLWGVRSSVLGPKAAPWGFMFSFLAYFTLYNRLQFHPPH